MSNYVDQLLHISIITSGIIVALLVINYFVVRRYSLKWMQVLWLLVAVRMLLPANLLTIAVPNLSKKEVEVKSVAYQQLFSNQPSNIGQQEMICKEKQKEQKAEIMPSKAYTYQPDESRVEATPMITLFINGIVLIWLAGALFSIVRYMCSYLVFRNRIMNSNEVMMVPSCLGIDEKVRSKVAVYKNENVKAPFSFGLLHKAIILPKKNYSERELGVILNHEYTHICNHDIEFKTLLCLIKSIHWFNPFVYFMERTINQNMELICDEEVIREQNGEYRKMYGMTILNTLREVNGQSIFTCATHFGGEKKQIKERFRNIMNPAASRKKPFILTVVLVLVLGSSLITCKAVNSNIENTTDTEMGILVEQNLEENKLQDKKLKPITILVTGKELIPGLEKDNGRIDCIFLLRYQPELQQLEVQSLCRDLLVDIPDGKSDKLSYAFAKGGIALTKETVEQNFGITVDYVATVDYEGFRHIIDQVGGIDLEISQKEAEYLSKTNYISKKSNRTLKSGINRMNGDQALGYARIRYVPTIDGEQNDLGRVNRHQRIVKAVLDKCKSKSISDNIALIREAKKSVETDMPLSLIISYAKNVLGNEFTLKTVRIPVEESYEGAKVDGKSVIVWDKEPNLKVLQ